MNEGCYADAVNFVSQALKRPLDEEIREFFVELEKTVHDLQDTGDILQHNF
jgi:hypothetical protein